jgi:hypothetical protein
MRGGEKGNQQQKPDAFLEVAGRRLPQAATWIQALPDLVT